MCILRVYIHMHIITNLVATKNLYIYIYSCLYRKCILYYVLYTVDVHTYMYIHVCILHSMYIQLPLMLQTYGITVQHANKSEISLLKNKGVVGGKAGRCALFSASDVCNMFRHWKTAPPQPITELAEGKVRDVRVCTIVACCKLT